MKKNKIKNTIIAVSLAATMTFPAVTSLSSALIANADYSMSFIDDTDNNNFINIDESRIMIDRTFYSSNEREFSVQTSDRLESGFRARTKNGRFIVSSQKVDVPALDLFSISFVIHGDNLVRSNIEDLQLTVHFFYNDKDNYKGYKPSEVKRTAGNTYRITYSNIIAYGTSFSLYTQEIKNVDNISCTNAKITPIADDDNYCKLDVTTPSGENLLIRMKAQRAEYEPLVTRGKMYNWAKMLCVYANSLSQLTGVQLDTLFMNFDHPYGIDGMEGSTTGFSSSTRINETYLYDTGILAADKYGYVAFNEGTSDAERRQMNTGNDILTWSVLHEVAHAYALRVDSNGIENNYIFNDEYLTNVRGLTAMYICDNLHDTDVHYQIYDEDYYGKYNEIAHTVNSIFPCHFYQFASNLAGFDWEQLKTFFEASSDNDPNYDVSREVAILLNDYIDMDIPLSEEYLRMANTFRKLMVLRNGAYNRENFIEFMNATSFDSNLIREIVLFLGFDKKTAFTFNN